jgi:hypothetical protein
MSTRPRRHIRRRTRAVFRSGEQAGQRFANRAFVVVARHGTGAGQRDVASDGLIDTVYRVAVETAGPHKFTGELYKSQRRCLRPQADKAYGLVEMFVVAFAHDAPAEA